MNSGKLIIRIFHACLLLMVASAAFAQNLNKKISIAAHDIPLGEVIDELSKKGDILFSYNPQSIPVEKKITIVARNTALSKIFEKVFTANGIGYTISEKQVILKILRTEGPVKPEIQLKQVPRCTLSGYIRDKSTGEAIIGANVYDMVSLKGTTTNSYGFYSLSLPQGEYRITFSFIGYTPLIQDVKLDKNIESITELELSTINMKEVEITTDNEGEVINMNQSGEMHFSPAALKQIPGFAGNVDILKSLQIDPGIVSFGDGSSYYYVRGGNSDQNMLLIDEAPIYNPSHLFGFFSALAPSAIKDVKVYKGDFPANYGGRLSSVVDIRAREGNLKQLGVTGNIGPYTCDFTLEGPIIKEKSSFLLSGRKSILNWLPVPYDEQRSYSFNFYDINAKFNISLNKNNRLFLTTFNGNDVFDRYNSLNRNTFGISWKNVAGVLRWNHIFDTRLFSNTTVYISKYSYYLDISKELKNYWNSSITNASLKTDFSWFPNPKNTLKTGFEINGYHSNPGNIHYTDQDPQSEKLTVSEYQSAAFALYASNDQQIGHKFFARYGFRLTHWNNLGPASVYFFDANHTVVDTIYVAKNNVYQSFLNFEPRIKLKYAISDYSSLKLNYSHTVQHLQVISNSTSPFTSLDAWIPCGPNIQPQEADLFSLGFTNYIFRRQLEVSAEAYYKLLNNQIDYADHANLLLNPLLEGELRFGSSRSYGIETLVRKSKGKFTGWISYTYSRTTKQIAEINHSKEFPAAYDRPHTLNITFSYATAKRWSFSSHWIYLTGAPFTSPTGFYYSNGYTVPLYTQKHNDRYPAYHRLDLSVSFALSLPEKRYQHNLILTVYNAYGRHNPFSVNFNKIMDDNGNIVVPSNLEGGVELIPTSISVAGAIPSLNYTFRF